MDILSPEHGSDDAIDGSVFSDDGAGSDSSACWAKEMEEMKSEYTCKTTLLLMCRSYGISEDHYKPLCAQAWQGPCKTPPKPSNALCVFKDMLEAGVRFPLHKFYDKVLTHFSLAPGQLTPNAWRYLAGFVLLCEGIGVRPMLAVFRRYFKFHACRGQGFYCFDPCSNNRLFKINCRLPSNEGWRKRFFFLESNKPWGCPKEWGMPTTEAYAKLPLTEVAKTAINKLEAEKGKRDIELLDLLDQSRYRNSFPILSPLPTPMMQVKTEGSHGDDVATASASTHSQPTKRMCLAPAPSIIMGGTPPCQLSVLMPPSPPGFPPIPVGSSSGNKGSELSMSQMVCKLIQDGEAELLHTKHQLGVERADEVSRLQNDVTQLTAKLKMEKEKNIADAHRFTEDLEAAKAEHAKTLGAVAEMREELKLQLKVLQASHAQLTTKVELLTKDREAVESEHKLKVHNLMMEDLQAEKDKQMAMGRQFREELQAVQDQHAAQVRQLQEAHAAEMNTIIQQWQLKVINAKHMYMSGLMIGELMSVTYAQGLRDMRDLALSVCPDADPARLTPDALAAKYVPQASPLQAPMEVDHQ